MSATLKWRCDLCGREAETVESYDRSGLLSMFHPKLPTGWVNRNRGKGKDRRTLDVCSQRCVVQWTEQLLSTEKKRLADPDESA
jgi:hypothetical protein